MPLYFPELTITLVYGILNEITENFMYCCIRIMNYTIGSYQHYLFNREN